ncbi:MAG: BON domain-containing protein [Candidatus Jettenia sp.]|uniref:Osmotically-inducible protein Y n=1 Tax=Candidatus Jettenia caeni TaxID=247490 RepID=I3ILC7_9BACT|nr:BON domain-containing protein [Candidatus Jettenia sp. AMX1]MBC6927666.1 BON domain-containing protein [Candidatus Jettenia sp.]NUN22399.1 BON domain-containing protein [Candidatus Jettenia caeni]KAA0250063.1 MAG: BON domain-containing protein [Candidatus Jettenia sp. AMX1]MCE7880146.1 BON domain-containing protein [Candidatus Jettenia sp. AMX1]MCQ3926585.1 BON domain-containing protein [Candidatus Jettenia sp.]
MKSLARYMIVFVFVAAMIGCAGSKNQRSTGEYIDDATITTKIKSAFASDPVVDALDIKVKTFRGNVQLSGFADTSEQAVRAEEIAEGVEGVESVENDIIVK